MNELEKKRLAALRQAQFNQKMFELTGISTGNQVESSPQSSVNRFPSGASLGSTTFGANNMFSGPLSDEERQAEFANKMSGILSYGPGDSSYDYFEGVGNYWGQKGLEPVNEILLNSGIGNESNVSNAGKPHRGMEANTSPFSQALLEERRQANMPKETFSPELLAGLRGQGVGARHHAGMAVPKPEEEDEFGFLDAMFLANLVGGMQGGPPPTPYPTDVGGGNKPWASLPTLMRMS